jgi:hypothetical protein
MPAGTTQGLCSAHRIAVAVHTQANFSSYLVTRYNEPHMLCAGHQCVVTHQGLCKPKMTAYGPSAAEHHADLKARHRRYCCRRSCIVRHSSCCSFCYCQVAQRFNAKCFADTSDTSCKMNTCLALLPSIPAALPTKPPARTLLRHKHWHPLLLE